MDLRSRDALLTLATGVLWVGGVALVVFGDFALTVVGIALLVLSTISLPVDAKDFLVRTDEHAGE
jgi:hypothetical protein